MSDLNYVYAVARIRVLEKQLLSNSDIEQLIAAPDAGRVLSMLRERGWGDMKSGDDPAKVLLAETEKTWGIMRELKVDPSLFEIFSLQDDYHNLKAAIKSVCTGDEHPGIFVASERFGRAKMMKIVEEKDFASLPEHMRTAALEAYEALLHTRDGQLADIILDKAALTAIGKAGAEAKEALLRDYAAEFVAVADIRIAARCAKTGKARDFLTRAVAPSSLLNTDRLIAAASGGIDSVIDYLAETKFAGAAEALRESPSAFECWCDNRMIETIRPQKRNPFSAGPVIAYFLARENEIKMARIILTAKANSLPDTEIRKRAREMYV